jgi:hypothetical protein
MQGTYRGEPVTHFVDPNTGLNVIRDASDNGIVSADHGLVRKELIGIKEFFFNLDKPDL